jgi:hypothetical protein
MRCTLRGGASHCGPGLTPVASPGLHRPGRTSKYFDDYDDNVGYPYHMLSLVPGFAFAACWVRSPSIICSAKLRKGMSHFHQGGFHETVARIVPRHAV